MPQLSKVISEEDLRTARTQPAMDLTPYLSIIDSITENGGVGGEVALGEDETKRTEKRRLSLAAKQKGYKLTWRKATDGQLRFVLYREGGIVPGGRKKK